MKRAYLMVLSCCAVLAVPQSMAEEKSHGKAVEYRNSVMTVMKWNISPMGAMLKGKIPYDKAVFARHARDLSAAAHLDLLSGFPEGSDEHEDTSARMDIWMDWESFEDKLNSFRGNTKALAEAAESGDLKVIGPKFGAVGKGCKDCHDAYRD